MATTNRVCFSEASEEFYLHIVDMDGGQEVYLEGHRFIKGVDGELHLHPNQLPRHAFDLLSTAVSQLREIGFFLETLEDDL